MAVVPAYPTHPLVVHLPAEQSRRALAIVNRPDSPYASLSELIAVAVENQLTLEEAPPDFQQADVVPRATDRPQAQARRPSPGRTADKKLAAPAKSAVTANLLRLPNVGELATRPPEPPGAEPLSPFTNRINPLVAGPRALLNLMVDGGPPAMEQFLERAAEAARAHGLRLRTADERAGRRGRHRRWTAWPVGDEGAKSLVRFRKSFLLWPERDGVRGPLVELGLVVAVDGLVYPTEAGIALANGSIPVLDDDTDDVLSEPQRAVLAERLAALPGERAEITAFLDAVSATGGPQDEVDKHLGHRRPEWTEAQVVSSRAAMIGRLRDLLVVDVDPQPGARTVITPGPAHDSFRQLLATASFTTTRTATE